MRSMPRKGAEEARNQLPDLLEAAEEGRSRQPIALDTDIAESAARLRASLRLKLADAIQAASALAINAAALVTHDRDFSRVRALRIIS
jgi:predicted nucleic acid-binding protein